MDDDTDPNTDDKLYERVIDNAVERMENFGVENYLCTENSEIEEDTECPAGTIHADKYNAI